MISEEEYKLLKVLGNRWEWIARDERDSDLFAHRLKPIKQENEWFNVSSEYGFLCTRYFQFIEWEDEEPWNIQELIEEYEKESEK